MPVQHHPHGIAARPTRGTQARIIQQRRARTHHDCHVLRTHLVHQLFGYRITDNQRFATQGLVIDITHNIHISVCRLRPFQHHIRTVFLMQTQETLVQFAASGLFHTRHHLYSGFTEHTHAITRHLGIGVKRAHYYFSDTFLDNQFGARRRFAVMAARFQRDKKRTAGKIGDAGLCRMAETVHFRMPFPETLVPSFRQHFFAGFRSLAHQYGANHRIGSHIVATQAGQLQAATHIFGIIHSSVLF